MKQKISGQVILFFVFLLFSFYNVLSIHAAPEFWPESTTALLDEAWPSVITTLPGGTTAVFWSDAYHVYIATSSDGKTFTEKAHVAISTSSVSADYDSKKITSLTITQLSSVEYRMIYAAESSSGVYTLRSATSTIDDMITWVKSSSWGSYMINGGNTFIDSPFLLQTTSYWYLFYTRDKNSGNDESDYVIAYATSTDDGVTWSEYHDYAIDVQSKDPQVIKLSNGSYRMYYIGDSGDDQAFGGIRSARSSDLVTFTEDSRVVMNRSSADDTFSHPRAVQLSDGYTYRLYYGYTLSSKTTPYMLSARTTEPYLISISPASGINDSTVNITVTGEIFSPVVTVKLSRSGRSDITATGVSRTNDTTVTGTFDIRNRGTGSWDLTILNSNNKSDTMTGVFKIESIPIPAGIVEVSENVFNPLQSQRAAISYTIYSEGNVAINIYTMLGELVKKLVSRYHTVNSYTENWDGKNKHGDIVASGIYLVHIQGPGLDTVKKIAVVK